MLKPRTIFAVAMLILSVASLTFAAFPLTITSVSLSPNPISGTQTSQISTLMTYTGGIDDPLTMCYKIGSTQLGCEQTTQPTQTWTQVKITGQASNYPEGIHAVQVNATSRSGYYSMDDSQFLVVGSGFTPITIESISGNCPGELYTIKATKPEAGPGQQALKAKGIAYLAPASLQSIGGNVACVGCDIQVSYRAQIGRGEFWQTVSAGQMDEQGEYFFVPDKPGEYRAIVSDNGEHIPASQEFDASSSITDCACAIPSESCVSDVSCCPVSTSAAQGHCDISTGVCLSQAEWLGVCIQVPDACSSTEQGCLCTADRECCTGMCCGLTCQTQRYSFGASCTFGCECLTGVCDALHGCAANQLTCTPLGQPCTTLTNCKSPESPCCCSGNCDSAAGNGTCQPPVECKRITLDCKEAADCCSGYCNSSFQCDNAPSTGQVCIGIGLPCIYSEACCSHFCSVNSNTCVQNPGEGNYPDGQECISDFQCASGYCNTEGGGLFGFCQTILGCKGPETACNYHSECCSGYCNESTGTQCVANTEGYAACSAYNDDRETCEADSNCAFYKGSCALKAPEISCDMLVAGKATVLTAIESPDEGKATVILYYESGTDRIGVANATVFVYANNSEPASSARLCKVILNESGMANFSYSSPAAGCDQLEYTYCPLIAPGEALGACLQLPGQETVDYNSVAYCPGYAAPASVPIAPGGYAATRTMSSVCAPKTAQVSADFCWLLALIFGLLAGAMFVMGKSPLQAYDMTAPRFGRGRPYQMRQAATSASVTSIITAADKVSGSKGSQALKGLAGKATAKVKEMAKSGKKETKAETAPKAPSGFVRAATTVGRAVASATGLKKLSETNAGKAVAKVATSVSQRTANIAAGAVKFGKRAEAFRAKSAEKARDKMTGVLKSVFGIGGKVVEIKGEDKKTIGYALLGKDGAIKKIELLDAKGTTIDRKGNVRGDAQAVPAGLATMVKVGTTLSFNAQGEAKLGNLTAAQIAGGPGGSAAGAGAQQTQGPGQAQLMIGGKPMFTQAARGQAGMERSVFGLLAGFSALLGIGSLKTQASARRKFMEIFAIGAGPASAWQALNQALTGSSGYLAVAAMSLPFVTDIYSGMKYGWKKASKKDQDEMLSTLKRTGIIDDTTKEKVLKGELRMDLDRNGNVSFAITKKGEGAGLGKEGSIMKREDGTEAKFKVSYDEKGNLQITTLVKTEGGKIGTRLDEFSKDELKQIKGTLEGLLLERQAELTGEFNIFGKGWSAKLASEEKHLGAALEKDIKALPAAAREEKLAFLGITTDRLKEAGFNGKEIAAILKSGSIPKQFMPGVLQGALKDPEALGLKHLAAADKKSYNAAEAHVSQLRSDVSSLQHQLRLTSMLMLGGESKSLSEAFRKDWDLLCDKGLFGAGEAGRGALGMEGRRDVLNYHYDEKDPTKNLLGDMLAGLKEQGYNDKKSSEIVEKMLTTGKMPAEVSSKTLQKLTDAIVSSPSLRSRFSHVNATYANSTMNNDIAVRAAAAITLSPLAGTFQNAAQLSTTIYMADTGMQAAMSDRAKKYEVMSKEERQKEEAKLATAIEDKKDEIAKLKKLGKSAVSADSELKDSEYRLTLLKAVGALQDSKPEDTRTLKLNEYIKLCKTAEADLKDEGKTRKAELASWATVAFGTSNPEDIERKAAQLSKAIDSEYSLSAAYSKCLLQLSQGNLVNSAALDLGVMTFAYNLGYTKDEMNAATKRDQKEMENAGQKPLSQAGLATSAERLNSLEASATVISANLVNVISAGTVFNGFYFSGQGKVPEATAAFTAGMENMGVSSGYLASNSATISGLAQQTASLANQLSNSEIDNRAVFGQREKAKDFADIAVTLSFDLLSKSTVAGTPDMDMTARADAYNDWTRSLVVANALKSTYELSFKDQYGREVTAEQAKAEIMREALNISDPDKRAKYLNDMEPTLQKIDAFTATSDKLMADISVYLHCNERIDLPGVTPPLPQARFNDNSNDIISQMALTEGTRKGLEGKALKEYVSERLEDNESRTDKLISRINKENTGKAGYIPIKLDESAEGRHQMAIAEVTIAFWGENLGRRALADMWDGEKFDQGKLKTYKWAEQPKAPVAGKQPAPSAPAPSGGAYGPANEIDVAPTFKGYAAAPDSTKVRLKEPIQALEITLPPEGPKVHVSRPDYLKEVIAKINAPATPPALPSEPGIAVDYRERWASLVHAEAKQLDALNKAQQLNDFTRFGYVSGWQFTELSPKKVAETEKALEKVRDGMSESIEGGSKLSSQIYNNINNFDAGTEANFEEYRVYNANRPNTMDNAIDKYYSDTFQSLDARSSQLQAGIMASSRATPIEEITNVANKVLEYTPSGLLAKYVFERQSTKQDKEAKDVQAMQLREYGAGLQPMSQEETEKLQLSQKVNYSKNFDEMTSRIINRPPPEQQTPAQQPAETPVQSVPNEEGQPAAPEGVRRAQAERARRIQEEADKKKKG